MSNLFKYSLLKYVHSDLLGEYLNVGILFYFPAYDKLVFKYPKSLSRIKDLYKGNFSDTLIYSTLRLIDKSIRKSQSFDFPSSLIERDFEFLKHSLLTPDSTALRFDLDQKAVAYAPIETIVEEYYNMFFSYFEDHNTVVRRNDEEFIAKSFKNILRLKSPDYQKFISPNASVVAPILPDGKILFDFSWNNDVIHYVKPISFDLVESKNINSKAAQYFGYLSALSDTIGQGKVDILTTPPQNRDLWANYDKAVSMISNAPIKPNIIEKRGYENYAQEILDHAEEVA